MLSDFSIVLLFLIGAIIFSSIGLFTARIIRPNRPNSEKNTSYECGEEAKGSSWGIFNAKFYIIALVFILFDVELIFLFPWATVFGSSELISGASTWGWFSLAEAFIFILILALGLAYVWSKGLLEWKMAPNKQDLKHKTAIPSQLYEAFNNKYEKESS